MCDRTVFLRSSPRTNTVLTIDRRTQAVAVSELLAPRRGGSMVMGLEVDCGRQTAYVVTAEPQGGAVLAVSTRTGELLRTYALPPWTAGGFVVDRQVHRGRAGRELVLNGFWPKPDLRTFLSRPAQEAFAGADLGLRLDLVSGRTTPLFGKAGRTCRAPHQACGRVPFDRDGDGWVLADLEGPSLRFTDAEGREVREIPLQNTSFVRSATAPPPRPDALDRWAEAHSVITQVYAFDEVIAVAHSRPRSIDRASMPQFESRLSLVGRDGRAVVEDVVLRDLPVGRDESGVYVIDYGPGGRRADATAFTVLRYDIDGLRKTAPQRQ